MYHSGIGGGGFALIRDKEGRYEAIDFRESAPEAAFENMYKNDVNQSITGGLAAGVPSEVRGLEYIHNKYGVSQFSFVPRRHITHISVGFTMEDCHAGSHWHCSGWLQG